MLGHDSQTLRLCQLAQTGPLGTATADPHPTPLRRGLFLTAGRWRTAPQKYNPRGFESPLAFEPATAAEVQPIFHRRKRNTKYSLINDVQDSLSSKHNSSAQPPL